MRQTGKCFEDFAIGDVLILGEKSVTREEILAFAREYDPAPMHLTDSAVGAAFSVAPEVTAPGAPPAEAIVAVEGSSPPSGMSAACSCGRFMTGCWQGRRRAVRQESRR